MIFCHKCGSEQLEGSEFCRKCGAKLLTENSDETSKNAVHTETPQNSTQSTDNTNDANTVYEHVTNEVSVVENKSHTKIVVLIIACVLALAAAGIIVAVIMTNNKSDTEDTGSFSYVESSVEDENALDATYSSKRNEITLKYPSSWEIDENTSPNIEFYIHNTSDISNCFGAMTLKRFTEFKFNFQSMKKKEIEDHIKNLIEDQYMEGGELEDFLDFKINSIEQTTLGGIPAVKADFTDINAYNVKFHLYWYFYDTNTAAYTLFFTYAADDLEAKTIIDDTIKSIKITINETQTEPKTEAKTEKTAETKATTTYRTEDNTKDEFVPESINSQHIIFGAVNVTSAGLYLRHVRDLDAEWVTLIPNHTILELYECGDPYWYYTEYDGEKGYVYAEYIQQLGTDSSTVDNPQIYSYEYPYKNGEIKSKRYTVTGYSTDYIVGNSGLSVVHDDLVDTWHVTAKNYCYTKGTTWYELWDTDDGDYYGWVDEGHIFFYQ